MIQFVFVPWFESVCAVIQLIFPSISHHVRGIRTFNNNFCYSTCFCDICKLNFFSVYPNPPQVRLSCVKDREATKKKMSGASAHILIKLFYSFLTEINSCLGVIFNKFRIKSHRLCKYDFALDYRTSGQPSSKKNTRFRGNGINLFIIYKKGDSRLSKCLKSI